MTSLSNRPCVQQGSRGGKGRAGDTPPTVGVVFNRKGPRAIEKEKRGRTTVRNEALFLPPGRPIPHTRLRGREGGRVFGVIGAHALFFFFPWSENREVQFLVPPSLFRPLSHLAVCLTASNRLLLLQETEVLVPSFFPLVFFSSAQTGNANRKCKSFKGFSHTSSSPLLQHCCSLSSS